MMPLRMRGSWLGGATGWRAACLRGAALRVEARFGAAFEEAALERFGAGLVVRARVATV